MTREDYAGAAALWRSACEVRLRALDDSEDGIARFLARNPRTCFVAERGGILAGALLSGHDGRRGFIYHAAVRAEYRSQGLGSALLSAAEQALRREGIHKIALAACKTNAAGNRFWEKRGFFVRDDLVYRDKSVNEENS